ncbi:hypothetical protein J6590_043845 [Homalodisca vitripennis]|nr:hypothetical protein J6590_043845 [Homalodisca vitripennis]
MKKIDSSGREMKVANGISYGVPLDCIDMVSWNDLIGLVSPAELRNPVQISPSKSPSTSGF